MIGLPTVGDRYQITRELDRSGTAVVYVANDRVLLRQVAVKVLTEEESAAIPAETFASVMREMARMVHPNIVALFDSGTAAGRHFYVMPFVEGDTLRTRLSREGLIAPAEAAAIIADVAEALAYAHGRGIVHRDIKPENIFCHHGRAMVADFGVAALRMAAGSTRATDPAWRGAAPYMSPELATSASDADARSDVYALGCVAFEMLTGDRPYPGPTPVDYAAQHQDSPVPRVRSKVPGTPSRIAELAERMMAKPVGDRPASAAEFLSTMRRVAEEDRKLTATHLAAESHVDPRYDDASMSAVREGRVLFQRSYQGGPGAKDKLEYAKALFERARDLDPRNPYAVIGLADVHHVLGFRGYHDFNTATRLATELRAEALRLDPDLPDVHISIGVELLYWKDDFATAGTHYRRAMQDGRARPDVHRLYGAYLKMAGRLDDALRHMRIGLAGDAEAPSLHVGVADVLMAMGRYVEAVDALKEALRLNPSYESALERLDITYSRLGRHDDAADARRSLHGIRQRPDRIDAFDADVARLGADAARAEDVRRDLAEWLERATSEDPFKDLNVSRQIADHLIIAYAELGEWAKAMDWIERGFYRRPGRLRRVLTDLPFDRRGLAADPRYAKLLRTASLEELL
jgi:serine/threonine protein kinase